MKVYKGIAGSPGIAHAKVLYYKKNTAKSENIGIDKAIEKALEKVRTLHTKTLFELGEEKAKIFSAYEMLLEDAMLTNPIKSEIESGKTEKDAIKSVTESAAGILEKKKNEYMRRRADDIRYIGSLLIDMLSGADFIFPEGDDKFIIAAHELTPVDTMQFDSKRLAGLATELGGTTSHTVILAKSLGIPAVVGITHIDEESMQSAYIDGYDGTLVVAPDEDTEKEYGQRLASENILSEELDKSKASDAYTKDGERIYVYANIGKPSDLSDFENAAFDGVGLFRSEFLYSSSNKKPSFKEQVNAYRDAIKKMSPRPVTIRTLDIGGDKQLDYLNMKKEENPFLGSRGIRLCLANPEIFKEQLKAILTAGAGESVKIMLPMVTSLGEVKTAKSFLEEVKNQLTEEKTDFCRNISLGIMIETPASAIMADVFAKHVDFFSIGTNDLVQYINAADRGNSDVENLYNPYNPAVIRMLSNVIGAGAKENIDVSMCGDLAANTSFTEVLLGMGLKKFSVPLPMLGRVKNKIGKITLADAKQLAHLAVNAEDEKQIEQLLKKDGDNK